MVGNLTADGLSARTAGSAHTTRTLLSQDPVDLLLVDVNGQTLELLDALRGGELAASSPDTLALVLTGSQDELHRVRLLERGADDVQLKPFSYPELRARIQALLRRPRPRATPQLIRAGTLAIDPQTHTAQVNGQPVQLTRLSVDCWSPWLSSRSGCSRASSCCVRSGGSTPAVRARWTLTTPGCAASSETQVREL